MRVVADLKAILVTALATAPGGKLYAATMPDATILEVDPRSGKWRQLAKLPAKHIWALVYDTKRRTLFAGTGAPGKIYAVRGGKPKVYYDLDEHHVLSLALDGRGRLLAGSNDKAILYRISGEGKGMALHDFDATELRSIVVSPTGSIYVAVNAFSRKTSGLPRYDREPAGAGGTVLGKGGKPKKKKVRQAELRPGAKQGKGALYRIDREGRVDELLTMPKSYFTDLAVDARGIVWAADGTEGKVFLVRRDRTVMTAFDLRERQVLALAVGGKEQYIATGDAGAIYRVTGAAKQPAYVSRVFDAKYLSRWGAVRYQATGKLQLMSRSGNTAKPDKTWDGWRGAKASGLNRYAIKSPSARYLQLKVVWPRDSDVALRSLTSYYRPQNQRGRVTEITFKRKLDKSKRRTPRVEISWKVDNPDKDELRYYLYYREEMGVMWRSMRDKPVTKAKYEWDTEPIPDDRYRVKVVASDEAANGPEVTQRGSRISAPLLVDNRKPAIVGLTVRYPWVSGMARDTFSPISRIEYSVDGKRWRLISANDGVFDTPTEGFRLRLPALGRGPHIVAVRARDEAGNIGVAQAGFVR